MASTSTQTSAPSKPTAPVPAPAPAPAPSEPTSTRFVHPEAYAVFVLTPYDNLEMTEVGRDLQDEFDFLEKPPSLVKELPAAQMFPGVVVYVAHHYTKRERDPETRKFTKTKRFHVGKPIALKDYFALSKHAGGLDILALERRIFSELQNDPHGSFYIVRKTADGGLKIHAQ